MRMVFISKEAVADWPAAAAYKSGSCRPATLEPEAAVEDLMTFVLMGDVGKYTVEYFQRRIYVDFLSMRLRLRLGAERGGRAGCGSERGG